MTRIYSIQSFPLIPELLEIEVASLFKIPSLTILGMSGRENLEARERIQSALTNSGFKIPKKKILLHLASSHALATGRHHDLAMVLGLIAFGRPLEVSSLLASGKVGLTGELQSGGHAIRAIASGIKHALPVLLPEEDQVQAVSFLKHYAFKDRPTIFFANHIKQIPDSLTQAFHMNIDSPLPIPTVHAGTTLLPAYLLRLLGIAMRHRLRLLLITEKPESLLDEIQNIIHEIPTSPPQLTQKLLNEEWARSTPSRITETTTTHEIFGKAKPFQPGMLILANQNTLILQEPERFKSRITKGIQEVTRLKSQSISTFAGTAMLETHFGIIAASRWIRSEWDGFFDLVFHVGRISGELRSTQPWLKKLQTPVLDPATSVSAALAEWDGSETPAPKHLLEAHILKASQQSPAPTDATQSNEAPLKYPQ